MKEKNSLYNSLMPGLIKKLILKKESNFFYDIIVVNRGVIVNVLYKRQSVNILKEN